MHWLQTGCSISYICIGFQSTMDTKLYPLEICKIVSGMLYVIDQSGEEFLGKHAIFKTLYLADKMKLAATGYPIWGSHHVKMEYGPVNSAARDIFEHEYKRGEESLVRFNGRNLLDVFEIQNETKSYKVKGKIAYDLKYLTKKDLQYLNMAIEEMRRIGFGDVAFARRAHESHDEAWEKATLGQRMSIRDILKAGGGSEDLAMAYDELQAELEGLL
jgi:hypothetical protein